MTKKEENNTFDWEKAINELEISNMLKKGLIEYIKSNNVNIRTDKDLLKTLNKYKKLQIGG